MPNFDHLRKNKIRLSNRMCVVNADWVKNTYFIKISIVLTAKVSINISQEVVALILRNECESIIRQTIAYERMYSMNK